MAAYDSVLTRCTCVNGHEEAVEVQYGYGPVRYRDHVIGEEIDWTLEANEVIGDPGAQSVRVLAEVVHHDHGTGAFSFECPICGAPYDRAVVEIRSGVIAKVRAPLEGEVEMLLANGDLLVDE